MDGLTETEFALVLTMFRVVVGLTFAAHGWAKRFSGGKIDGTAAWFDAIGMRPGRLHANAASTMEMLTGVLLAIGFLTSFAAAGMIGIMVVAGWAVHRASGFFIVSGGWEYTFVTAAMAATIAGLGPGAWSVDHGIGLAESLNGYTGLGIAIALGVVAGAAQIAVFFRPPAADAGSADTEPEAEAEPADTGSADAGSADAEPEPAEGADVEPAAEAESEVEAESVDGEPADAEPEPAEDVDVEPAAEPESAEDVDVEPAAEPESAEDVAVEPAAEAEPEASGSELAEGADVEPGPVGSDATGTEAGATADAEAEDSEAEKSES